jgi:hypothetical protein
VSIALLEEQNQVKDFWTRNAVQAVLEYPVPPFHEVVCAWQVEQGIVVHIPRLDSKIVRCQRNWSGFSCQGILQLRYFYFTQSAFKWACGIV